MNNFEYEYPEKIELDDGQEITLSQEDMKDERYIAIVLPSDKVDYFANFLKTQGFKDATPAWDQGEKYGLSKIIYDPWEMHIRIFENGQIYSHIEVRRDYFEHLDERYIWPVYDEPIKLVKQVTDAIGTLHVKSGEWVRRVITKARVTLSPPSKVTEWRPVAAFAGGIVVGASIAIGLIKLLEYLDELKKRKNQF